MRVCLYTETALPKMGGHEFVVDALARQFQSLGHEPLVLAPYPRLPLWPRDHLLPYPVVRHPRFFSTRFLVSWYRWFLLRLRKRFRFDVLHCHGLYPQGYLASLTAESLQVPIVLTSHGGDVFTGGVRLGKPMIRRRIIKGLERADALVAISPFTREGYSRLCPEHTKVVDIPNGVDLDLLSREADRPTDLDAVIQPRQYFLFLGRLKERKGVDFLLNAFAKLGGPLHLVIAGDGEERRALEDLTARLSLRPLKVHFTGTVAGQRKAYLLQNALCGVVPSRRSEASPLVVLEMNGAGIPAIAAALQGLKELVVPGESGWHARPECEEDLARILREAAAAPEETRRRGQVARARAQAFGWKNIARRHVALYEELLDRRLQRSAEVG